MRFAPIAGSIACLIATGVMSSAAQCEPAPLVLNDAEYFEQPGFNAVVFSNWYNGLFGDSKISGVELIHHGERMATNGDIRLNATPEQWDLIPEFVSRHVDPADNSIQATLRYPDHDFTYTIVAKPQGGKIKISVVLPAPLPPALAGKAGFNLEFLPATYFETSYLADGKPGTFPLYPTGIKEINGQSAPQPLAEAATLTLAPEDDNRRITVTSNAGKLRLYDGRSKAQNGWFVLRQILPEDKSGTVLEWNLEASTTANWQRAPVIGHSQVGYLPSQQKRAVIELDKQASLKQPATLIKIAQDGSRDEVLSQVPTAWGDYTRYQYAVFDFTKITTPGLYQLSYGETVTAPFVIGEDVYASAWHATLDHYFPVQMDHVLVNEAYRVWHGASHLDDALQAPVNHQHFDLYAQGPTTDTAFEPGEHIPGLNVGGWYDAGDYDIRTQTQYATVRDLVNTWEEFNIKRDTTLVDYDAKFVDLHVADGKPDVLQQIEHGTLALVAQYEAVGHAIPGIIVPDISQYTHLGDGITMTDNLIYDPSLDKHEANGLRSGKFDDRWAFTSKSTPLNYGAMAALAAASRALAEHAPALADNALTIAKNAWHTEANQQPDLFHHGNTTGGGLEEEKFKAAVELLITTGEAQYADAITALLPALTQAFGDYAVDALRVVDYMGKSYKQTIQQVAERYQTQQQQKTSGNPYQVEITEEGWAGNGTILQSAIIDYYLHKVFPQQFDGQGVYRALDYLYGTHPDSDISFVSGVGTQSKKVAYGMNRADYSFIAGAIVPGVLILKPDLPENKENWPFMWGQNEYVINVGASYLFTVNAARHMAAQKQ